MKFKNFNWGPGLFLIIYQILLLISLPFYFYHSSPGWQMWVASVVLLYLAGLSITAGYHRLYSHRTYRTTPVIESVILFFGSMAGQGSALRWGFDHRLHHAYVDTDNDPYSIKKGFWYAHFLWILEKPRKIDPKVVPDLMKNPLVLFQHKYSGLLMLGSNVAAFFCVGFLLNDYTGAFFIACWLRLFALHHFTWFINSLAHTWGDKPFCQEQSAVNNYVISLLTFGEGYHNYHHTFANDYRNGIRWYHFDPTKWVIRTLHFFGLASGLKTVDAFTIKKRMIVRRKELLSDQLCRLWYIKKDEVETAIQELSDRMLEKIALANRLMEDYRIARGNGAENTKLKEFKRQITEIKKSFKEDWRLWVQLSRNILNLRPIEIKAITT